MSDKTEVIGVRFKEVGKVYYFDPNGMQYSIGDRVIVEAVARNAAKSPPTTALWTTRGLFRRLKR